MDLGYDVIVTITGIVLVFLILVLLMAIITLEGKIFDAMNGKKAAAGCFCCKTGCSCETGRCARSCKGCCPAGRGRHPRRRCGSHHGSHLLYGQRQVCAEGSPPRQEWLGQGWRQRHHRTLLTQEEEHDTVY